MAHTHSNLVRLAPLQTGDLPGHPQLPLSKDSRSETGAFLQCLLDDGCSFLSPGSFAANFKHHSTKSSSPSAVSVEAYTYSLPETQTAQISWSDGRSVKRSKPRRVGAEHWVARRSVHRDISSKNKETPGHASWEEFIYGLRDEHSIHESEFTPTIYDARPVLDWNAEVRGLAARGELNGFTQPTLAILEMCHTLPSPLSPRLFTVLVATASIDENSFVAVTIPVSLSSSVEDSFYSTKRNVKEGQTPQQRKGLVPGVYAAVEIVRRDPSSNEIEWIMATASDAKGNLPMWLQKPSVPSQIIKDVGFFLKWIRNIDDSDIQKANNGLK